mgnify:CR=1 FL=1
MTGLPYGTVRRMIWEEEKKGNSRSQVYQSNEASDGGPLRKQRSECEVTPISLTRIYEDHIVMLAMTGDFMIPIIAGRSDEKMDKRTKPSHSILGAYL